MANLHFSLDKLPPHLRAQAERQLGLEEGPEVFAHRSKVFAIPHSTPPSRYKPFSTRAGGVFKANLLSEPKNAPQALPVSSPAGFKSIAEMRAEKKDSRKRKYLTPDMAKTLVKSCKVSDNGSEVQFLLDIDPYMLPTAQQKGAFVGKDGKVHFFTKAKVAKSEKALIKAFSSYADRFSDWGNAPVAVHIDFCFPFTKSSSKKSIIDFTYHTSRADLDNLAKGTIDSLTQSKFWEDDSLISDLHLRKFRVSTEPRIILTIRKLPRVLADNDLFGNI